MGAAPHALPDDERDALTRSGSRFSRKAGTRIGGAEDGADVRSASVFRVLQGLVLLGPVLLVGGLVLEAEHLEGGWVAIAGGVLCLPWFISLPEREDLPFLAGLLIVAGVAALLVRLFSAPEWIFWALLGASAVIYLVRASREPPGGMIDLRRYRH